jgi:hypothetical protein
MPVIIIAGPYCYTYQHVGVDWVAAVSDAGDAADSNAVIVPVVEYRGRPAATVAGITDGVSAASAVLGLRPGAAVRPPLSVAAATRDAVIIIDVPCQQVEVEWVADGRTSLAAAVVSAAATGAAIVVCWEDFCATNRNDVFQRPNTIG